MTPWLLKRLGLYDAAWVPQGHPVEHFIVTGSVLNWASKHSVVWGAGLASWKDEVPCETDIRAVRGPLSLLRVKSCGWKRPRPGLKLIVADPALLLPKLVPALPKPGKPKLGIIPHYVDMARFAYADDRASEVGVTIIDPLLPVKDFCERVSECWKIVSSSLHGLIVADAYGIPNTWAKFGDGIGGDGMKFWDYLASVERATVEEPPEYLDLRNAAVDTILLQVGTAKHGLAPADLVLRKQRELLDTCPFIHASVYNGLVKPV